MAVGRGGAANDSTENVAHLPARANVSSGGCNAVRDLGKLVEEILWPTVIVSVKIILRLVCRSHKSQPTAATAAALVRAATECPCPCPC